jgi:hypothetical protein
MAIYQLPTGTYETRAIFAVSGAAFRDMRHFAAKEILVRHPDGELLIDAGFGHDLAAHVAVLPRIQRAPLPRACASNSTPAATTEADCSVSWLHAAANSKCDEILDMPSQH